jgi:integrase
VTRQRRFAARGRVPPSLRRTAAVQDIAAERGWHDATAERTVKRRVGEFQHLPTIDMRLNKVLVYFALGVSLRRAEVLGLHWEDVNLEQRSVSVHRRVNRVGKKAQAAFGLHTGLIVRDGAKSESGERTVILPQLLVEVLRTRRRYQLEDKMAVGDLWQGADYSEGKMTGFIFTGDLGRVLEPRQVDLYFASVRERAKLDGHTFHGLRHDFAGLLLAAGVPGRVVSEMMGHANYSITANIYQHVPDELQRLAADHLDTMLSAVTASG